MDHGSFYFGCSHNIRTDMDHIQTVRILNAPMCKDLVDFLPYVDGIDCSDPVFSADRCYLWKGAIKKPKYGHHKSPSAQECHDSFSIVRRLFTCIFHAKLGKQILRHMCPLITGEFNSGMCCNPLHLRPGTAQENFEDRKVHEMLQHILKDNSPVEFCFQHNQGMLSSLPSQCNQGDLQLIQQLFHKRGLDYLLTKCVCNVIKVEPRNDTKDLDFVTTHWREEKWGKELTHANANANANANPKRKYERKKATLPEADKKENRNVRQRELRERKRCEKKRKLGTDEDRIHVVVPPPLDVQAEWEAFLASNPLPTGLLPVKKHRHRPPTQTQPQNCI